MKAVLLKSISRTAFYILKDILIMKRNLLLFPLLALLLLLTACVQKQPVQAPCTIDLTCSLEGYSKGVLTLTDGTVLDSLCLTDGHLSLLRTDSAQMPYVAKVKLVNDNDPTDDIYMPIVVEGGTVTVVLSELYTTKGTPLNKAMQQFFVEMQRVHDSLEGETNPKVVAESYSAFFKKQILLHSNDVIGRFVLEEYGPNMTADDGMEVKTVMK